MIKKVLFFVIVTSFAYSQKDSIPSTTSNQLKEVILNSSRIDLKVSENSRSIQIISSTDIKKSGVTNVIQLLQQLIGIDIRQRGLEGNQADLYIRGGSFDQTLLLIDGIKLDDSQTGHHTLNFLPPVEVIERIEVLKGSAARIYGQNAFTGAINIVTKNIEESSSTLSIKGGSYGQVQGKISGKINNEKVGAFAHYNYSKSDGYRYNTDFRNQNVFLKSRISKLPIYLLGFYTDKKFGANGFYATPTATEQYEETSGNLIGVYSTIKKENLILKPRLFWRRNNDHYLFIRDNPSVYENFHTTDKVGAAVDLSIQSSLGVSGIGVDFSNYSIDSNLLGQRNRNALTVFIEQRFLLAETVDITPGIAITHFSDFGNFYFPGLDVGFQLSDSVKLYGNWGLTYRIPTFTDLYYQDRTTLGNADLIPEEAINYEVGLHTQLNKVKLNAAYFIRISNNLIDYVKNEESDLFMAQNIQALTSKGIEAEVFYPFVLKDKKQQLRLGYSHLSENLGNIQYEISRYVINSFKNQFTFTSLNQWHSNFYSEVTWRYGERYSQPAYHVVDFSLKLNLPKYEFSVRANNLFSANYSETNLVPQPLFNATLEVIRKL